MALATQSDLAARLGQYYTAIYASNTALADAHLEAASAEVESYIGLRYKMPPVTLKTQNLSKHYCLTLAEELAWGYQEPSKLPETVRVRAEQVRKILLDIAEGKVTFADGEPNSDMTDGATFRVETPLFTREKLGGY